ncbi:hypothetical protein D3C77_310560 [compost metagenome]
MQHFVMIHRALLILQAVTEHLNLAHIRKPFQRRIQPGCGLLQLREHKSKLEQSVGLQKTPIALAIV